MSWKQFCKHLLRSRSLQFARDFDYRGEPVVRSLRLAGQTVHYRPGSSDMSNIHDKLLKAVSEYWVPERVQPKVVFDIGANVGTATLAYRKQFPNARIFCFEPAKENFEVLKRNTADLRHVSIHNFGLGPEDSTAELHGIPNRYGGYSLFEKGSEKATVVDTVTIRKTADVLAELKVDRIDLIKIDTEGFEYEILSSFPDEQLAQVQWIVGELHSRNDFKLLDLLSGNFDIDIKKTLGKRNSKFNAANRSGLPDLARGYDIRRLQM